MIPLTMTKKRPRPFGLSRKILLVCVTVACLTKTTMAFVSPHLKANRQHFGSITTGRLFALPDIDSMKASEMRKELESYGVSTKSFFERGEFADALKKARSEGETPKKKQTSTASRSTGTTSRTERIKEEMEKLKKLKVSELKKELTSLGISTKSFFEKSEFVKALAEARVDGAKKNTASGVQEEEYDPSYRDVVMQKYVANPRELAGSPVIDIRLR